MSNNNQTPRFPAQEQTPENRAAFAEAENVVKQTLGSSFQLKDSDGNLLGPFQLLSYALPTFAPYLAWIKSVTVFPAITPKERELSILAVTSITKSKYVMYAHKSIAISLGLTEKQALDASEGKVPEGLEKREEFVYGFALKMARQFGVVDEDLFEGAVEEIGRDGVAQLAQVVGGYVVGSIMVNVADVKVPA